MANQEIFIKENIGTKSPFQNKATDLNCSSHHKFRSDQN